MQALINSLLEYSKIGTIKNTSVNSYFNEIIQVVLTDLKLIIEENQVTVTYNNLPTLKVDQSQMIRLFQNLITNAVKYHSDALPEIKISAEKQNNHYLFSVADNGIGIDAKYYDKVFEVFQLLEIDKNIEGTGIGLANCKKIIEHHGGTIWVKSSEDKGSTFYFTLPV